MKSVLKMPELIRTVYDYEKNMDLDYETLGKVAFFFGIIIYAVNFKNVDQLKTVLSAYMIGTALILIPFICRRVRNKKGFLLNFLIFLGVVLTFYGLFGVNDGISYYWGLLAVFVIFVQFGMPVGLGWCTFFLVFSIVIFYTPVRNMLPYHYSDEYAFTFPLMYACTFVASFVGNLFYKKNRIDQDAQEKRLMKELGDELEKVDQAMFDSVAIVSALIDEKDQYTKEHSLRVARYSKLIAEKSGYAADPSSLRVIYNAALLHDIGKIAVPDRILNNSEGLSDEEYKIVKNHTKWGSDILKELTFYPKIFYGARYHHERYDGKGYPDGLKGDEIPMEGRIIAVADTLDAMNSVRVYRKPCAKEYIINVFENDNGEQFEPKLAYAVCELIREGKIKILADDIESGTVD